MEGGHSNVGSKLTYALIFFFPDCPPSTTIWREDLVETLRQWKLHDRNHPLDGMGPITWLRRCGFPYVPEEEITNTEPIARISLCPYRETLDYRLGHEVRRIQL